MPSAAAATFTQRVEDIDLLMEIHGEIGKGPGKVGNPGPRVEVLNRSAVVLITAIWEGYCEDLAKEALAHVIEHATEPTRLPSKLMAAVVKELRADEAWRLAGDGWKSYLTVRLINFAKDQARAFNAPMSKRIDELFLTGVGLPDVTSSWHYAKRSAQDNRNKIDGWVGLRQDIAHGSGPARTVNKPLVINYVTTVRRLVPLTDKAVDAFLTTQTGVPLF